MSKAHLPPDDTARHCAIWIIVEVWLLISQYRSLVTKSPQGRARVISIAWSFSSHWASSFGPFRPSATRTPASWLTNRSVATLRRPFATLLQRLAVTLGHRLSLSYGVRCTPCMLRHRGTARLPDRKAVRDSIRPA
jgi:hypothetical protein